MAFRTVVIRDRCKLEFSLNYLICRKNNSVNKILLDEIKAIIIDNNQIVLTAYLIAELLDKNIKVIFIDSKHNPKGELVPYNNSFYSYRKIKEQMSFDKSTKGYLWKIIIKEKIFNQASNLKKMGLEKQYNMLIDYFNNVIDDDQTNREGHSAKVYFNCIFGEGFTREKNCNINMFLNYGYAIIMSLISREIKAYGYLTELGIHHIGESNSFNLSCDLMEPLRPLVDLIALKGNIDETNFKEKYVKMLSMNVLYNDKEFFLDNAIHLYVEDIFIYLRTGDITRIRFIKYEL